MPLKVFCNEHRWEILFLFSPSRLFPYTASSRDQNSRCRLLFFFWEITHTSPPFFPEWKERENKNLRRGPSLLFTLKKHFCTSQLHHNNIAIKIHLFSFSVDPTCGPISTLHFLSILKRCLGKWYFVSRVWGRFLSVRNDSGFPTQKRWMLGKNT